MAPNYNIEVSNAAVMFDSLLADEDPDYLEPFVDEITSLENQIVILFCADNRVGLVFDQFVDKGKSRGNYLFFGNFWLTLGNVETVEHRNL
jgi:hypothetical protein